jgi:hypothetical protein
VIDCEYPLPVRYLAGVPRFLIGQAVRDALRSIRGAITRSGSPADRFASELNMWDLGGFVYGKHFYRPPQTLSPAETPADPDVQCHSRSA